MAACTEETAIRLQGMVRAEEVDRFRDTLLGHARWLIGGFMADACIQVQHEASR
jgi:hypothetical protein